MRINIQKWLKYDFLLCVSIIFLFDSVEYKKKNNKFNNRRRKKIFICLPLLFNNFRVIEINIRESKQININC